MSLSIAGTGLAFILMSFRESVQQVLFTVKNVFAAAVRGHLTLVLFMQATDTVMTLMSFTTTLDSDFVLQNKILLFYGRLI